MKTFTLISLLMSIISLTTWAQCNFDYTYSIDTANNTITFNNTSVTSTSGSIYMSPDVINGYPYAYTVDNNFISGSSSTVTYYDADTYVDVCMYNYNAIAGCSDTICKTIYLPNACGYTLDLAIVDNLDGSVTYTNTNNNTILFETGLINYFENSYTMNAGQSITHSYNTVGTFPYLITVSDSSTLSCYDTNYREITINQYCNVDASFTSNSTNNDLTYSFNVVDTTNACSYFWDFDDGSSYNSSNPTHTFTAAGTYNVTLTVTSCNSVHCADTAYQTITVVDTNSCNTSASYDWYQAYDSTNGTWTNTIYIVNQSVGNNLSYAWDFNNGNYSFDENPTTTLLGSSPYYYVCLEVFSPDSCDTSYCDSITLQGNFTSYNVVTQSGYSKIEEIESSTLELGSLYPNPTTENTFLTINSTEFSEIEIRIIDVAGKLISYETSSIHTGENTLQLTTQSLTQGVYIISVSAENGYRSNLRLLKN